ncbi:YbhB/YbcL family Raf kinase inhibitor-like protein [Kocuria gwangalliensis]|uniref:YbhB/YbcL family Raf kinase inhibitor-like protein n=1 Tax=Kocuria gwangalliensis TaxID=501592 RepID=A0ABP8WSP0_9MICC
MFDREPYADLPDLPTFTLTSTDVAEGETMATAQVSAIMGAGGEDISPQLSWSGAPEGTKSYVVTMFDPDAPTPSGFWHWCVSNIPASVTELATGAALNPPEGAVKHRNDGGTDEFVGAAPPEGHGAHRYILCVTAVDVAELDVDENASPAVVNFNLFFHGIARAFLTPVYEVK